MKRRRESTKQERERLKRNEDSLQELLSVPAREQGPIVGSRIDCKHDQGLTTNQYCLGCGAAYAWIVHNREPTDDD